MPNVNTSRIDINNFSGLEELDDNAAASLTGGMAQLIAFDDDDGGQSPPIDIPTQQRGFNLEAISRRIGININNIADRFTITGTTAGTRYRVTLLDEFSSEDSEIINLTGNGEDISFDAGPLRNRVSIVRLKEFS